MAGSHLLVPIAVEALVVNEADKHGTLWSIGSKQYGGLSRMDPIEPHPFAQSIDQPRTGITLHWALPDALTRGRRSPDGQLIFPTVPNRWLVIRMASGPNRRLVAKVVESDFLGASGTNPHPDPLVRGQLTRLGRSRDLSAFVASPTVSDLSLRLTALGLTKASGELVGAADPAFAAYVPNVVDVFAFQDDLADAEQEQPQSLSYMVMGWYDRPEKDPLNDHGQFDIRDDQGNPVDGKTVNQAVMDFFKWDVAKRPDDPFPNNILCHGMVYDVRWTGMSNGNPQSFLLGPHSAFADFGVETRTQSGEHNDPDPERTAMPQIAIGNSTVDGLASLIEYLLNLDDAGVDLSTLVQALDYGLASSYDDPGGREELIDRIHQAWFAAEDGGSLWEVEAAAARTGDQKSLERSAQPVNLTPEQAAALSALNSAQREFDNQRRSLRSLQLDLYTRLWRSLRSRNSGDPVAIDHSQVDNVLADLTGQVKAAKEKLGPSAAPATITATQTLTEAKSVLAGLLPETLVMKESKMPRFWRPADPVVVVYGCRRSMKHGGDGRFSPENKLFCRISGQEASSLVLSPLFQVTTVTVRQTFFSSLLSSLSGPSVPAPISSLICELVLLNPAFAQDIFGVTNGLQTAALQQMIWQKFSDVRLPENLHTAAGFSGVRPSPVAVESWAQPWAPLFLSWRVTWFPSNPSASAALDDWQFNGNDYDWIGIRELSEDTAEILEGKSIVGGVSTKSIIDNLSAHLEDYKESLSDRLANSSLDSDDAAKIRKELEDVARLQPLVETELRTADFLAQPLTGFHDQLIMRDRSQYLDPPADAKPDGIVAALEDGPRLAPIPHHFGSEQGHFYPVRAGHFRLDRLWIVDAFGQVFDPILERGESPLSFTPLRGSGLVTTGLTQRTDTQALQMPPRLVQPSRLQFRFVDAGKADPTTAGDASFAPPGKVETAVSNHAPMTLLPAGNALQAAAAGPFQVAAGSNVIGVKVGETSVAVALTPSADRTAADIAAQLNADSSFNAVAVAEPAAVDGTGGERLKLSTKILPSVTILRGSANAALGFLAGDTASGRDGIAALTGSLAAPFDIPAAGTFSVNIDGGITISASLTAGPARSAAQVVTDLNAAFGSSALAEVAAGNRLTVSSRASSSLRILNGSANAALGLAPSTTGSAEVTGATSGPFHLVAGQSDTLQLSVGNSTVTVALTASSPRTTEQIAADLNGDAAFVSVAVAERNGDLLRISSRKVTPVCGWILPNHLDHSITVFDADGHSLGAVLLAGLDQTHPLIWEPTVAGDFAVAAPSLIPNPHLSSFIATLEAQTGDGPFTDLMQAIDSTLWTTEPLGKRGDHLSALIGRPLAVVRASVALELSEAPATRQLWEDTGKPPDTSWTNATFHVRLGDSDLRDDGVIGHFVLNTGIAETDYGKFFAVHPKLGVTSGYVQDGSIPADMTLAIGEIRHVTLLVDPRGSMRARCGILPSKSLRLPRTFVAHALETMNVTFRVGPILNELSSLRMPLPVDVAGSWSWIANTGVALAPFETITTISSATQQARLTDEPLHIREGYLKLSDAVGKESV